LGAGAYVKKPYIIEKLGLAVKKELDRTAWTRDEDINLSSDNVELITTLDIL
jgi:hypothetical protein